VHKHSKHTSLALVPRSTCRGGIALLLQCVTVCCSVLQCVAVCCSVLQCVAVCCRALQCVAAKPDRSTQCTSTQNPHIPRQYHTARVNGGASLMCSVLQSVAVCCSALQCVTLYCHVWWQCIAVHLIAPNRARALSTRAAARARRSRRCRYTRRLSGLDRLCCCGQWNRRNCKNSQKMSFLFNVLYEITILQSFENLYLVAAPVARHILRHISPQEQEMAAWQAELAPFVI